uniref:Tight junction protein ZO-2 n=1 Tax=Ascaris suum TaxID=6253 RepID=F1KR27_ASCSU
MWEGHAVEGTSGWVSTFGGASSLSSSIVVSSSSPRLSSSETPTCSMLDRRRHSELDTASNEEMLVPPVNDDQASGGAVSWQLLSVTLRRVPTVGFGIAVSGGRDNPHFTSGDPAVVVSDVVPSGPAWGLVQVNDRILSANGVSLENAEYAAAVKIMKESQQLNMIVKRRAPIPLIEFEQRTLKFTLSKSRKKEDFGIVLGCKYYIKEITNRKLAEKDPGLREGDTVLRINGQSVDGVTIEEATKWLLRSREKLSLVVQRDVRRGTSRWPSQTTVYERLGSLSATPRHSPSPMLSAHQPLAQRSSNDYVNSATHSTRWPQADQQSVDYGEFYRRNGSVSSSQGQTENSVRVVSFRKVGGSLGVRVIGGNRVGIFVSAVQEDSPAALNSIRPGERILSVNDKSMVGITREEAVRHLLLLSDDVTMKVEYAPAEFEQIRNGQLGDDFYIRTHFANQKVTNQLELTFHNGDIFHITDTLFGGTVGLWQATRVYSTGESASGALREPNKGVIPNAETAEGLMKASRTDTSTLGRSTFFRRKLKERRTKSLTKNAIDDVAFNEGNCDVPLPAYERVILTHPPFQRPVVLYGPLADAARQLLLSNFALRFASARDQSIVRLSSIDAVIAANKHCILDVSPGSVERLHLAQYAPIVILIDVENRARIRELRAKAGAPSISSRKLIEQMHKIKKNYSHLLTATLDATKEDGWFEALRQLIAHLQDRRVWMPEFRLSSNPSDVILLPMQSFQNQSDSDVDSLKGDYSTTDYVTKMQLQTDNEPPALRSIYEPQSSDYGVHVPRALHVGRSQPHAGFLGAASSYYQNVQQQQQLQRSEPVGTFGVPLECVNATQSAHSPARRYLHDVSCDTVPWVTLPRRHNYQQLSHVATNHPQQQMLRLTTPSCVAQYSPVLSRRTQHCASPALVGGSPRSHLRAPTASSVSPVRSPFPPPHSSSPIPNRPHSSPAPLTPPLTQTHVADSATPQPTNTSHGYYDVKQILAEQSSDYYGHRGSAEVSASQHYQNAQGFPYIQQMQSFAHESAQQPQAGIRSGLFYDHLTRGRWAAGSYNERRLGSTPVHGQPSHSVLGSSPATSSPLHTESVINDGPVRYVDDSPKSQPDQEEVNNDHSNEHPATLKTTTPNELGESEPRNGIQHSSNAVPDTVTEHEKREATVIEHVSQVVDSNGCTLSCPESGVMLIIPKGAIDEGVQQEIYVKVCRANCDESRPPLDESRGESLMSPLVMCGPQDLHFNVPVELRLPHSASNNGENWSFALKSGTGEQWNQIALDGNNTSLVTDKFASVKICHF